MARRRKSDTPVAEAAADNLLRCPSGHNLPHKGDLGECTPVDCGAPHDKPSAALPEPARALATKEKQAPGEVESGRIALAEQRLRARLEALAVPEFKDAADAETWADRKLAMMLPLAIADVEADLRWGDDTQRATARRQVLEATGRGRRDGIGGGSGPSIVIIANNPNGTIDLPWAQKVASISTTDARTLTTVAKKDKGDD
jgi:hypothetical protein